jgi:hypothetical protein
MEDKLLEIKQYLPISFQDEEIDNFISYLGEAYVENLENGKFQFAFTAFHMLNMVYIYKIKWILKQRGNSEVQDSLDNFTRQNHGAQFNTLFDLSQLPEKTSLEKVLKALSFHANDIDICKNHVGVRNNCSHASGRVYYKTQANIDNYIDEELDYDSRLQQKLEPIFLDIVKEYLDQNWENPPITTELVEYFKTSHFSEKDLLLIAELEPPVLSQPSSSDKVIYQKILFLSIIAAVQNMFALDRNMFLEHLPSLVSGLPAEVSTTRNGDSSLVASSSILEEYITPIITNFPDEERDQAESILQYA